MGKSYRMVFLDLDGTTLTTDKKIPYRTQRILRHLQEQGIPVVIATGRVICTVRPLFSSFMLDSPVITLNGAVIYDRLFGKVKQYEPLPQDVLEDLFRLCRQGEAIDNLLLEGLERYFVLQTDADLEENFVRYRRAYPETITLDRHIQEPVTALLIRPSQNKDEVHERLAELLEGRLRLINTPWHWIETLNPKVNKGVAMKALAESCGVSLDEVVAFGDEWNDVEMLRMAGLGVAMKNGTSEAKAAADLIAPSNDEEGVAVILEEVFADLLVETRYGT